MLWIIGNQSRIRRVITGPIVTTNNDGSTLKKTGNTSFTASLEAFSSALWRAMMRRSSAWPRKALRDAGFETVGLDQHRHQLLHVLLAGAVGEIVQH